ncbi:MAG: ATP-binding protein [Bacteroidetes bacterium]|nr:ATP-binding protein [Bacteroidota bacterium]
MVSPLIENAQDLELELSWFAGILDARLNSYFGKSEDESIFPVSRPDLSGRNSYYASFVTSLGLEVPERIVLVLALIPHIRPQLLDVLWTHNEATGRGFSEFGGWKGVNHGGFIPTGETAAFIIAGDELIPRFEMMRIFEGDHPFATKNILSLSAVAPGEPLLSGALEISREYLNWFLSGVERKPNYNIDFPAKLIETQLDWDQLVLPAYTLEQLGEFKSWILHGMTLLKDWGMDQKLKPGYTSLFYGPPGTGKTFSACLLGKHCDCDVYRIDLSMIVSKYIGETEKNLARIFDMAEHKNWILFFDEADSLFGKRTRVEDSHDRYANQEVSYLLQRIEDFNGIVILATNLKVNIDEAFLRRFQSVIHFPMPKPSERNRIWGNAFSNKSQLDKKVDLQKLSERYEISGGTIMNAVRFASLRSLSRNSNVILAEDLEEAIRREFMKEGKSI